MLLKPVPIPKLSFLFPNQLVYIILLVMANLIILGQSLINQVEPINHDQMILFIFSGSKGMGTLLIVAIVLGCVAGAVLVAWWITSLYNCFHHVYKYWCSCCHKKDHNDFHVTTVLANPNADSTTRLVAGRLPPSYSSIFELDTAETFKNESVFSRDPMPSTSSYSSGLQQPMRLPSTHAMLDTPDYRRIRKFSSPMLSYQRHRRNRSENQRFFQNTVDYISPSFSMGSNMSKTHYLARNHSVDFCPQHSYVQPSTSFVSDITALKSSPRSRLVRNHSYDVPGSTSLDPLDQRAFQFRTGQHVLQASLEPLDQNALQFRTRQQVLEALSHHIATSSSSINSDSHRSPKRKPVFVNKVEEEELESGEFSDLPLFHFRRQCSEPGRSNDRNITSQVSQECSRRFTLETIACLPHAATEEKSHWLDEV